MDEGYIKIHRKLINWEWYSNKNDRLVWLHCLLKANWNDGYFEGKKVPRGSFVTSYKNLSKEIGISIQQLRTSLKHLKSTHNLTQETNKQFSIITINNYDLYQAINTQPNKRATNEQQTINNNIRNNKKLKEEEKIYKKEKYGIFENVLLSKDEYLKLKERFNDYQEKIDNLSSYIASKGVKYKSHYATILNWSRKDDKNIPKWFNQEIKKPERTEEDERELQELIRGY